LRPVVLCYHAVSPTWEHRLSIQPDLLLRQVRLIARFRPVRATFDDAFRSAARVLPALERLDVPVTVFVCSRFARAGSPLAIPELAGDDPQELETMSWDDLLQLAERGIGIGSHTVSHAHLTRVGDGELRRELVESKEEIETELGRRCPELAYPYGEHDDRVRSSTRRAGYDRAYALWSPSTDSYASPRLDLYRRHTPVRAALMTISQAWRR
jgi:peptidoglycan/xylan/chitin deacetylase (PgdA/CDA1 family)